MLPVLFVSQSASAVLWRASIVDLVEDSSLRGQSLGGIVHRHSGREFFLVAVAFSLVEGP